MKICTNILILVLQDTRTHIHTFRKNHFLPVRLDFGFPETQEDTLRLLHVQPAVEGAMLVGKNTWLPHNLAPSETLGILTVMSLVSGDCF